MLVSIVEIMSTAQVSLPLPVLPEGWVGDKDFKAIGTLSPATQRNIEPVGPYFLAHARRVLWSMVITTCFAKNVMTEATPSYIFGG